MHTNIPPAQLREVLATIREAIDIPPGATIEDQHTRDRILNDRAGCAVIALMMLLDLGEDPARPLAWLREQLTRYPADGYKTWSELVDELRDGDSPYDDEEPYCFRCGDRVGIFVGHGGAWHHWRGEATTGSPVELFDAGHPAEVAWRPAGAL